MKKSNVLTAEQLVAIYSIKESDGSITWNTIAKQSLGLSYKHNSAPAVYYAYKVLNKYLTDRTKYPVSPEYISALEIIKNKENKQDESVKKQIEKSSIETDTVEENAKLYHDKMQELGLETEEEKEMNKINDALESFTALLIGYAKGKVKRDSLQEKKERELHILTLEEEIRSLKEINTELEDKKKSNSFLDKLRGM